MMKIKFSTDSVSTGSWKMNSVYTSYVNLFQLYAT